MPTRAEMVAYVAIRPRAKLGGIVGYQALYFGLLFFPGLAGGFHGASANAGSSGYGSPSAGGLGEIA